MAKVDQKLKRKTFEQRTPEDWDAIHDARTLSNAKIVRADATRLKRAKAWAAVLAEQENEEATALSEIANED